ncbi:MAG: 50S ribosomal protein L10 [Buchnera aphidicola (Chaetogeoica yunlongensis)]
MALNIQKKKEIVTKIHYITKKSLSIVVINPTGIKSHDITRLRKIARKQNVKLGVFKNTLLHLGIQKTPFEYLKNIIVGPTLIAYSLTHPGSAAKLLKNFSASQNNTHTNLKILGAGFEGKIILKQNINILADMPTFEEAIYRFIIFVKEISVRKLLRTLISIKNIKQNF